MFLPTCGGGQSKVPEQIFEGGAAVGIHFFESDAFEPFLDRILLKTDNSGYFRMAELHFDHTAVTDVVPVECRILLLKPMGESVEDGVGMVEDDLPVVVGETYRTFVVVQRNEGLAQLFEKGWWIDIFLLCPDR